MMMGDGTQAVAGSSLRSVNVLGLFAVWASLRGGGTCRGFPSGTLLLPQLACSADLLGFFTPNIPGRWRIVEGADTAV